jgi:hypothetical protein
MQSTKHDYHRGTHKFPFPAQIELQFCDALGGERKRVQASGSFTFAFPDDNQDITPFTLKSYEIRLPALEAYYGPCAIKTLFRVPAFDLTGSHFIYSQGWLQRSTGRFTLSMQIEVSAKEVPILGEIQRLGILGNRDCTQISAHLFEAGRIDRETGMFTADGTLYIGGKEWQRPGDPALLLASSWQCDASGSLTAGLTTGQDRDITVIACLGTPVTLFYSTTKARSAQIKSSTGDVVRVALPGGSISVSPMTRAHSRASRLPRSPCPAARSPCLPGQPA